MSKLQLPEGTSPNRNANFRCSGPPSVPEMPYMERFICKQKLHVAFERTEVNIYTFFKSLLTV